MCGLKLPERSSEESHMDPSAQVLSVTIREKDAPRGRVLRVSKSYLNVTYKVNSEGLLKPGAENYIMGPLNLGNVAGATGVLLCLPRDGKRKILLS